VTALSAAADALAGALAEESRLCARLLAVTQREEKAIIAADIPMLTALVDEKEQVLEFLATLETERMTALTAIASATGHSAASLTLGGVVALVDGAAQAKLVALSEGLRADGQALEQANARNAHLLRTSSELVDRWVQYLKTVITGALTYNPDGGVQGSGGNRMLDRSA
jgi:flagellar biosynthesis/type III secretory pathway chaperone